MANHTSRSLRAVAAWPLRVLILLWSGAAGCDGPWPFGPFAPAQRTPVSARTQLEDELLSPNLGEPASVPADAAAMRKGLLAAINAERARHGLPRLASDATLEQIADYHATRMIDGNFFAHVDPYDGSTVAVRAAKFDYDFLKIGENLAAGQESPSAVLADWLASPAHRANLLDPEFSAAGITVLDGGRYLRYWAIVLSRPIGPPGGAEGPASRE